MVAGAPTLRAGREYVLFLWTSRSGLTQLMGMSQGLFSVERTTAGDARRHVPLQASRCWMRRAAAVRDETLVYAVDGVEG